MNFEMIGVGLLQGLIMGLVAFAVMIPFRVLQSPDVTVEGAYSLGAVMAAALYLKGWSSLEVLCFALLGGGCVGIVTSVIHVRLRVNLLLAGIMVSSMLYSVSMRVIGKPSAALFDAVLFLGGCTMVQRMCWLGLIAGLVCLSFWFFLLTEVGLRLRAVGLNPLYARSNGISIAFYTGLGLFFAGVLGGLAGALMVSMQRYVDVTMGVGIVIHGMAALMMGEVLMGKKTILMQLCAPFIGALVYQQIQGFSFMCGLAPSDLKFFTGLLVLAVLAMQRQGSLD